MAKLVCDTTANDSLRDEHIVPPNGVNLAGVNAMQKHLCTCSDGCVLDRQSQCLRLLLLDPVPDCRGYKPTGE